MTKLDDNLTGELIMGLPVVELEFDEGSPGPEVVILADRKQYAEYVNIRKRRGRLARFIRRIKGL